MSQRATVTTTDGITLITMPNVPADIDFVAKIFENIANRYRNSFFDFCSADMYWTVC